MLNVLIVDDEAPIRQWLEYCVKQLDGFWVCGTARNGLQGIEEYKKNLPDIVITDIEMPNLSGLDMLKSIRDIKPTYVIVLTSYDIFAYAREALVVGASEYILKTEISVESLRTALNKAAGVLYKQSRDAKSEVEQSGQMMLRQLAMVGTQLSLTPDILRRKGITLDENLLFCGSIWSNNSQELSRIRQEIIRYPEVYNLSFVTIGYEELLMVCNLYREEALQDLIGILNKKLQKTNSIIGFSDIKPTVKQLPNALKEARSRSHLSFYDPQQRIFFQGGDDTNLAGRFETWRIFFSKKLYAQRFREAVAVKEEILTTILSQRPTEITEVKNLCAFLATTLMHFTSDDSKELESLVKQVEQEIKNSRNIGNLIESVNRIFAAFVQQVNQGGAYSEAIQKVTSYVNSHYREKLTLASVAATVSFSAEYLSRMFVKETGMNFVTYLNNVRLQHAVSMLEHTDKRIYEIAESVGYTSVSYFSTVFKKNFGITPNEYQARILENREKFC